MTTEPVPPTPSRADALGQLRRERWFAQNAGETARVAQIDRQIARLSAAGTATSPTRETTSAAPAAKETAAAPTTAKKTAARQQTARTNPKGTRRVRTAR